MSKDDHQMQSLAKALEDHSAEGIAILTSEPPRLMGMTIVLLGALMLVGLVWSFFGRLDVIVTVPGTVGPDAEIRRFYAPIDGELVDIYISEGQPVVEGDLIARLNARRAIEVASNALEAELKLTNAKREMQRFPVRKQLIEREIEAVKAKIEISRSQHEKRVADGMTKLAAAQQAKLQAARGNLLTSERALDVAQRELDKFERLYQMPGGGGVSKTQVEQRRSDMVVARENYKLAKAKLNELDYQLSAEYEAARVTLESSDQEWVALQLERDRLLDDLQYQENKLKVALRAAELEYEAASRIKFENIDEQNFLRILAPVTGVLTEVTFTQPGDKVQANTPLGGIAAAGAEAILKVEIPERDRAFLKEGQMVKMKFNAFAYQRYGFIEGELEYISPSTQASDGTTAPVYKGRIKLEKDFFEVNNKHYPLRYGMEATAEIVVRKRRLIDLALDPLRNLEG